MWISSLSGVRRLFLANTVIVIGLPLLGLVEWTVDMVLVLAGLYFVFDCLGIVLTFHRYHAHRGFEFRWRWMEILFTLSIFLKLFLDPFQKEHVFLRFRSTHLDRICPNAIGLFNRCLNKWPSPCFLITHTKQYRAIFVVVLAIMGGNQFVWLPWVQDFF